MQGGIEGAGIAYALVREYLKLNGCHRALDAFMEEQQAPAHSITSRNKLRELTGVMDLAKGWKRDHPGTSSAEVPSCLNLWCDGLARNLGGSGSQRQSTGPVRSGHSRHHGHEQRQASTAELQHTNIVHRASGRATGSRMSRDALEELTLRLGQSTISGAPQAPQGRTATKTRNTWKDVELAAQPATRDEHPAAGSFIKPALRAEAANVVRKADVPVGRGSTMDVRPDSEAAPGDGFGEMILEDFEDSRSTLPSSMAVRYPRGPALDERQVSSGRRIAARDAGAIVSRVLRDTGQPSSFPDAWIQGFFFNSAPRLSWGLVQKDGGPCGVIAAVQAHMLAFVCRKRGSFPTSMSASEQVEAMTDTLAHIIWQCRSPSASHAALAVPASGSAADNRHAQVLVSSFSVSSPSTLGELRDGIKRSIGLFMAPRGCGILALVASMLLTRGIDQVRSEGQNVCEQGRRLRSNRCTSAQHAPVPCAGRC
ncbi:unnamed protein product [Pedinophyceae sp. YPF-701]|nr:unnamed protein product [Pedinophyceae sp. YPF-701]